MRYRTSLGLLASRILIALIFVWAGLGKLLAWEHTATYMASKGMTYIPFFLFSAAGKYKKT